MTNLATRRGAILALVGLVFAVWLIHRTHGPSLGADDHGQYLLHAKALVEGRPYVDIGFIHTPYSTLVAPVAEPPGMPVVIAAVFRLFGQNVEAVRWILVTSFALFGLAVGAYFARASTPLTGALVAGWTLISLSQQHVLDTVLADLPFCAALWLAVLIADRGPVRGFRLVAGIALAGAVAFTFRMAALPLLPAAATALVLRDREERPGFLSLGVVWTLTAAAVMWWIPAGVVLGGESLRTPPVMWQDFLLNSREMLDGARGWVPVALPNLAANRALHGLVLLIALVGVGVEMRRAWWRMSWIFAAWYLVMLAVLPTRASHYMWPLYPMFTFGFLNGLQVIVGWTGRETNASLRLPLAIGAALVLIGFGQDAARGAPPSFDKLPDVVTMRAALRREGGESRRLRVAVFAPRVVAWEDGHTTMALFEADPSEMLRVLRNAGVTHVVVGDPGTHAVGVVGVQRLVRERPAAFREVFRNSTFTVFALAAGPRQFPSL